MNGKLLFLGNLSTYINFGVFILLMSNVTAQNLIVKPESIEYDTLNKKYFVTCNGNGKIIEIDSLKNENTFLSGFSNLLGSHLVDSTLYVSSDIGVQGFNIYTKEEKLKIIIDGKGQIDGITADTSRNLYVIDATLRKIYKINIEKQIYSIFTSLGLPQWPQDCIFDEKNNRLIVVAWAYNAPIQAIDLADSTISTIIQTNYGYFDGITKDQFGNIYVSSHSGNGRIYKYDNNFTLSPVLISSGHNEPAGICYNTSDDILAVPNYGSSTIDYITMNPLSVKNSVNNDNKIFRLDQNFPNPFNPETTISFNLNEQSNVSLAIYNLNGQIINNLVSDETKYHGEYYVTWNGKDNFGNEVGSGQYVYILKIDDHYEAKIMTILK